MTPEDCGSQPSNTYPDTVQRGYMQGEARTWTGVREDRWKGGQGRGVERGEATDLKRKHEYLVSPKAHKRVFVDSRSPSIRSRPVTSVRRPAEACDQCMMQ